MEVSWYQVKQREDRHRFSNMANDALLGITIIQAQVQVGAAKDYSIVELRKLLETGKALMNVVLGGIEFLRGSAAPRRLDPEMIFVINRIRNAHYLSLDELEGQCKTTLEALQHAENGRLDLRTLGTAEQLFNDIATSSRVEGRMPF